MPNETGKEEHEYPNIVERFQEVLKKLGVKKYEAYADHCAKGDLEDLEDVEQKLYELGMHPSVRDQVVNFWAAEIKKPVPRKLQKRLTEERGAKPREGAEGEKEPEKYSVDSETGAIKVASTSDKTALTWEEAEKLSTSIKKELVEKATKGEKKVTYVYDADTDTVRMAREGEIGGTLEQAKELKKMAEKGKGKGGEEKEEAKYAVDTETGAIRVATTTDKTALTWEEAEKLSQKIEKKQAEKAKKESEKGERKVTYVYDSDTDTVRMAREGEIGGTLEQAKELKKMAGEGKGKGAEESPFIQDGEGNWILNPKARVTGVELMALDSIRRAQERGEPVDPLEALSQAAEKMKVYREALGGTGMQLPDWMTDPAKFIETVERISGKGKGDETLRTELTELKKTLADMKEERYREQIESQQRQISTLTEKVGDLTDLVVDLRRPTTGRTEMDLLHEVATEGIGVIKTELPGFRRDIKEALVGGALPPPKSAEERKERTAKLRQAVQADKEIEDIGRRLFFKEG